MARHVTSSGPRPTYINADLELHGRSTDRVFSELRGHCFQMATGRGRLPYYKNCPTGGAWATFETEGQHHRPSATIREFAAVISGLSARAAQQWDALDIRVLSFGFERSGSFRDYIAFSRSLIREVERLGCQMEVVMYDPDRC